MTKIECLCGKQYWPNQAWLHKGCATNATNANIESIKPATNDRTANRRDRSVYNEYQREYMRKRRAK
jgi:hypothetical protein